MTNDKTPTPVNQRSEHAKPELEGQPAEPRSASAAVPLPARPMPGRPPLFGR
jgi:hypothetical protein